MKKAGVRFTNDLIVSFEYNEDTKDMSVLVVDGMNRYTGSVTVAEPAEPAATPKRLQGKPKKTTTK